MKKISLAVSLLTITLLIAGPISGYARGGGRSGGGSGHSSGGHSGGSRAGGSHISGGHTGGSHAGSAPIGGHRTSGGVVVRGGSWWGWWPWFLGGTLFASHYAPPPASAPEQPLIEIDPDEEQPYYWYYCQNPQGYYPYIPTCPSGWTEIDPDATPQEPSPLTALPDPCYAPRTDSSGQLIKDNDGNMVPDFTKPVPCPSAR